LATASRALRPANGTHGAATDGEGAAWAGWISDRPAPRDTVTPGPPARRAPAGSIAAGPHRQRAVRIL
jgi:hypothetical protein